MSNLIQGAGGGGKGGGGGSARVPVEAKDTLRSRAYARVLDLVSEGEIEGLVDGAKSIYLDGTPLQNPDNSFNFSGVEVTNRNGSQSQAHIPGIPGVENSIQVGVEVKAGVPVVRQVTNPNLDAVRVTISIPQLTFQNPKNGDLGGTTVEYAIDVQSNGGGFQEVVLDTVTGKTTTRYQRSYRVPLTGSAPWDIRVRRITADSTQVNLQNKTFFDALTEVIDVKLRYPNSALVAIKIDASQFQSIPTRGYDMKLLRVRVPSNYNPTTRQYTGSWNGSFQVAWTDNPAWCFYDLVTNDRYGLGGLVDEQLVDKWALYQIGRYCDELVPDGFGGQEPRFTCNLYLQSRAEAYKVLQDFASVFRAMVFWATGSVTAVQDAPSDPVALFTAANVIDGKFTYSGSGLKARHTVALVSWNDPQDFYRQKVEYVEDTEGIARYGVQQTEVTAIGCTSRGQANRVGRWLLFSERFETETVNFSVGLEGAVARPGHVIKVADPTRAGGRLGGRISAATTTTVTLDRAPQTEITGWSIFAVLPDGTVQERTIQSRAGNVVTVGTAFTTAPTAQSIWVLSNPAVEAQTFRVLGVTEDGDSGNYSITALKHEPNKYAAIEQGLVLQPRDFTLLNDVPPAPSGLAVSESLYTYQAEVRAKINVSWEGVEGVYKYFVDWRKDNGNYTRIETSNTDIEVLDITPGAFDFRVFSSNGAGIISAAPAEISINALGKTAPPADVTGLIAEIDKDIGITLYWDKVADIDLDGYEIRQGTSWETAEQIGIIKATLFTVGYIQAGAQTFLIRALDTSGNLSVGTASVSVTFSQPTAVTITQEVIDNNVLLRWSESTATLSIRDYIVKRGPTYETATTIGTISGRFTAIFETNAGTFNYWVAGVDLAGNVGVPAFVTAVVSQPPDYRLLYDENSTFAGTLNNIAFQDGQRLAPVNMTETWEQHFTSRGWNTIQDQINAGFPLYVMPSANAAFYEEEIDYGTVLAGTKVSTTISFTNVAGTVTATPTISVKKLAGDPWTDYPNFSSVFATDFRFIKIRYDFASTGGDDLITITGLNIRLDVKLKNDAGNIMANAADVGGTTVNFNVEFVDVESITVTASGTTPRVAIYDFVDAPYPTSFKVLLFDLNGNRVTGRVGWSVKGS